MDGIEAGWAIPLLLIGFTAVWLAFLMIAYQGGDMHSDVLETWTLGRSLEWGYAKHPPQVNDCGVPRAFTEILSGGLRGPYRSVGASASGHTNRELSSVRLRPAWST
jgi:hypothetical protein